MALDVALECLTVLLGRIMVCAAIAGGAAPAFAQPAISDAKIAAMAIVNAYPNFIDRIEGNDLVWKDGTRMPVDDGKGTKTFDAMLGEPDIKDMFSMKYPLGDTGRRPVSILIPDACAICHSSKKCTVIAARPVSCRMLRGSLGCQASTARVSNSAGSTARRRRFRMRRTNWISCPTVSWISCVHHKGRIIAVRLLEPIA
jgi:hypothetical protein